MCFSFFILLKPRLTVLSFKICFYNEKLSFIVFLFYFIRLFTWFDSQDLAVLHEFGWCFISFRFFIDFFFSLFIFRLLGIDCHYFFQFTFYELRVWHASSSWFKTFYFVIFFIFLILSFNIELSWHSVLWFVSF